MYYYNALLLVFVCYWGQTKGFSCQSGQYFNSSSPLQICVQCPAGTYCPLSQGCPSFCTQCPPNSGSMAGVFCIFPKRKRRRGIKCKPGRCFNMSGPILPSMSAWLLLWRRHIHSGITLLAYTSFRMS